MFNSSTAACLLAVIAAVVAPAEVFAQQGRNEPQPAAVRRPYRGLFTPLQNPNSPQSLVLSGSLFGAYDDNVLAGLRERNSTDWRMQRSGYYEGAHAALDYGLAHNGDRFSVSARAGGQLRYYRLGVHSNATLAPYYHGDISTDVRLTRATTLHAEQSVSYLPTYSFAMASTEGVEFDQASSATADPDVVDPDMELFGLTATRAATAVSVSQRFGRNTSLQAGYRFRSRAVNGLDSNPGGKVLDYRASSGFVRFLHERRLTSHASLDLGYGVSASTRQSGTGDPRLVQNVLAGLRYSRALSFSRRTSVSFSSGSAIVTKDNLNTPAQQTATRVRLIGSAALVHELGRTWTAEASYHRGLVFLDGFGDFFFTDRLRTGVGGLVTRRLSFSAAATFALATLDRPGLNRHDTKAATAQATYALSRFFGLFARYIYYKYDFGADVPLPGGVPRNLDRQGIRVGISTSIPLIR